jgi:FAD/FMN-containing dehydrogenase
MAALRQLAATFDPEGRLNPGVLVEGEPCGV